MKVTVYHVDRNTLKKQQRVQSYGNTKIALTRCALLISDLGGEFVYMENVKWGEYGIKTECILMYDEQFEWGFLITNSGVEKKMGPFRLPSKQDPPQESDNED